MRFGWNAKQESSPAALGVDIGTHTTKAMMVRDTVGGIAIEGVYSIPNPVGLVVGGKVDAPRQLGKILGNHIARLGVRNPAGVFSIPSSLAALRWVSVPLLQGDELRQAARFKVKRHLPYDVKDAYIEASIPEPEGDENTGMSLVIAVHRDVIDSRAETLEAAGVAPLGAELEAQAILRIVERRLNERSPLWRDASLTIIDVGGAFTHMYVVQNQRLQFIRGVRFGADAVVQSVSNSLGVSAEAADAALNDPRTVLKPSGEIELALGEEHATVDACKHFEKLTREFIRLLRYFRSLHAERSYAGILDHAIICGGLVSLHGFAEYLEQSLGLRVERARPFAGTIAQVEGDAFQVVSGRQEAFTVVMGLALAGLKGQASHVGKKHDQTEFVWQRAA
jgi:type IV pilus assembly protein PilM